jgi:hypothetical protein
MTTRKLVALGVCLAAAASLAGCVNYHPPPHLPAVFHIDAIRYWWEGDSLIVNVTFTNVHPTLTPGPKNGTLDPQINVFVREDRILSRGARPGEETQEVYGAGANASLSVDLSTWEDGPWLGRWTRWASVGPMLIPPGTTLSMEFGLRPFHRYEAKDDGYYAIEVRMPLWYSHLYQKDPYSPYQLGEDDAEYYTGCFNRVVPEFYGVKTPGADCGIWDCTGQRTDDGYPLREILSHRKPDCTATQAIGPDYD